MKHKKTTTFGGVKRALNTLYDAALRPLPFDPHDGSPQSKEAKREFVEACIDWQGRVARAYGCDSITLGVFTPGSVLNELLKPFKSKDTAETEAIDSTRAFDLLFGLDDRILQPEGELLEPGGLAPLSLIDLAECVEGIASQSIRFPERPDPMSKQFLDEITALASAANADKTKPENDLIREVEASKKWKLMFVFLRYQVLKARRLALSLVDRCTASIRSFENINFPRMRVRVVEGRCYVTTRLAGIERGPEKLSNETSSFLLALLVSKSWKAQTTPDIKNDLCDRIPELRAHIDALPRKRGAVSDGSAVVAGDDVGYTLSPALKGRVKLIRKKTAIRRQS